jgi:hypothetical protein
MWMSHLLKRIDVCLALQQPHEAVEALEPRFLSHSRTQRFQLGWRHQQGFAKIALERNVAYRLVGRKRRTHSLFSRPLNVYIINHEPELGTTSHDQRWTPVRHLNLPSTTSTVCATGERGSVPFQFG